MVLGAVVIALLLVFAEDINDAITSRQPTTTEEAPEDPGGND